MYERFTDRSRRVMNSAHKWSFALGMDYVICEGILLGITTDKASEAITAIEKIGIDLGRLQISILSAFSESSPSIDEKFLGVHESARQLTLDPSSRLVVEDSILTARKMNCNYVSTGHLLLGIASRVDTRSVRVLSELAKCDPSQLAMALQAEVALQQGK